MASAAPWLLRPDILVPALGILVVVLFVVPQIFVVLSYLIVITTLTYTQENIVNFIKLIHPPAMDGLLGIVFRFIIGFILYFVGQYVVVIACFLFAIAAGVGQASCESILKILALSFTFRILLI
eukprot:c4023_g1_i2.p2 GENE.c4023_g1_i2~~c4023_g1_i2.p2  ORF type:complete len:124 (+),score=18.14 c4023_g1_i2:53-424(+)